MRPHSFDDALPEFIAAFLVNRFVANDRQFMSARRHKDQHRIAFARLVHTEPMKLPLRRSKGITLQFASLDQNANLTGGPRFRFANRLDDPVVLEFAKKVSGPHFYHQLEPAPPPPK